ncbi:MAG: hypothetical protein QOC69_1602 [Mycobacterium sp.]|nr:hypothetical protein [Mycobacterium sp.]
MKPPATDNDTDHATNRYRNLMGLTGGNSHQVHAVCAAAHHQPPTTIWATLSACRWQPGWLLVPIRSPTNPTAPTLAVPFGTSQPSPDRGARSVEHRHQQELPPQRENPDHHLSPPPPVITLSPSRRQPQRRRRRPPHQGPHRRQSRHLRRRPTARHHLDNHPTTQQHRPNHPGHHHRAHRQTRSPRRTRHRPTQRPANPALNPRRGDATNHNINPDSESSRTTTQLRVNS